MKCSRAAFTPLALGSILLLSACSARQNPPNASPPAGQPHAAASSPTQSSPHSPPQPVVVSIVIDQFPAWMFAERVDKLPKDGGFARMRKGGTTVVDMRMPHACADTAPGHALLYSGAVPRDSGIIGNELPTEPLGARRAIVRDPSAHLVGSDGTTDRAGSSIAALRVLTVADALRSEHPEAVVVSISRKDRGAIFGGGRHPNAVLWYDSKTGTFVTSTAFGDAFPDWAASRARPAVEQVAWNPLDPSFLTRNAATPDAQPGEGDFEGLGASFPHRTDQGASARAYLATPFVDESVVELGLLALSRLHKPDEPMMLALSLSAMDAVGHTFGPDSWESWDMLLRLDQTLARILTVLDQQIGKEGYAVVVASDHGVESLPELAGDVRIHPWCDGGTPDRWHRPCEEGERIDQVKLAHELDTATRTSVGDGRWIAGVADPYVFLTDDAKRLPVIRRERLMKSIVSAIMKHRGIERVVEVSKVPASCPARSDESQDALVCRAVLPGVSGDLYMIPRRGSFFDPDYAPGAGSSHGTPNVYDRAVPMLVYAPGRVKAGRVVDKVTDAAAFPRTVSALLGIAPPEHARLGVNLVTGTP